MDKEPEDEDRQSYSSHWALPLPDRFLVLISIYSKNFPLGNGFFQILRGYSPLLMDPLFIAAVLIYG